MDRRSGTPEIGDRVWFVMVGRLIRATVLKVSGDQFRFKAREVDDRTIDGWARSSQIIAYRNGRRAA